MARRPLRGPTAARRHGAPLLPRAQVRHPRRVHQQRHARGRTCDVRGSEEVRHHANDGVASTESVEVSWVDLAV